MALTINSGTTVGPASKEHLSALTGGTPIDQQAELLSSLRLQIAEMVRVYTDNQRANRDFKAELAEMQKMMRAMSGAIEAMNARQFQFIENYDDARRAFATLPGYSTRLYQLMEWCHKLFAAQELMVSESGTQLEAVRQTNDRAISKLAEVASSIPGIEELIQDRIKFAIADLHGGMALVSNELKSEILRANQHTRSFAAETSESIHGAIDTAAANVVGVLRVSSTVVEEKIFNLTIISDRDDLDRLMLTLKRLWSRVRAIFN